MAVIDDKLLHNGPRAPPRMQRLSDHSVLVRAAGKYNLTLAVGDERPDGYHAFESLMATVTLLDELTITRGDRGIRIRCDDPTVPVDGRNLVYRAAFLLAWCAKISAAIDVDLRKRIPTEAGLGGGSSDAAACLIALNELWDLNWPVSRLSHVAAVLGSDVSFFLSGPLAICRGRGEEVYPLAFTWPFWSVLVHPSDRLPTPQVYAHHRPSDPNCFGLADELAADLATHAVSQVADRFRNDLEAPAFRINGTLGTLREQLERVGHRPVRMTGSGTAMFAMFDGRDEAAAFLERAKGSYPEVAYRLVRNNLW